MVRDPLIWLGCVDPCQTMETIQKQDSKLETRKQVAACWQSVLGETENTASGIVEEASRCDFNGPAHPEFFAALAEIASNKAGGLDVTRLGYWLRKVQGDVFSLPGNPTTKLRFAKVEEVAHGNLAQWILKVV